MSKAKKAAKEAKEAKNASGSAAVAAPPPAAAVPAAKLKAEVEEMQQRLKSLKEAVEDRDSPKIGKEERLRKSNVVKEEDEDVMEDENLEDGNEDGEEYPDYPDQPTFRSVSLVYSRLIFLSLAPFYCKQCCGSVTFWYESGSAYPGHQITDPESGSYSSLQWFSRCQHKYVLQFFWFHLLTVSDPGSLNPGFGSISRSRLFGESGSVPLFKKKVKKFSSDKTLFLTNFFILCPP
jgi:hypothetical protein